MARRLLEGDSRVWVEIDNEHDEHLDSLEVYKPNKASEISEHALFEEPTDEEKAQYEKDVRTNNKSSNSVLSYVLLGVVGLVVIIGLAYIIINT